MADAPFEAPIPPTAGPAPAPQTGRLVDWLLRQALLATPQQALVEGLGGAAAAAGLPVLRLHSSVTILHPRFQSQSATWWRVDRPIETESHLFGSETEDRFLQSPLHTFLRDVIPTWSLRTGDDPAAGWGMGGGDAPPHLRFRLDRGEGVDSYPILAEIAAAGGTDWIVLASGMGYDGAFEPTSDPDGVLLSWTSDRPGGFTDAEIAALMAIQPAAAVAHRIATDMVIARALLGAYLGPQTGTRVLEGTVRRGTAETIDAAILIADLRGFTALADRLPRDALVGLLDACLERIVGAVEAAGGEVLKFLGDGLLAIFPLAEGEGSDPAAAAAICADALAAAEDALARTAALNAERAAAGQPVMPLDIALHRGAVAYGNVGGEDRLDFTVIGPAVNEASRMEALCGALGCPLLVSEAFVTAAATPERFRPLGRHRLRGVSEPVALFTVV
jgi:adenylate cyclase